MSYIISPLFEFFPLIPHISLSPLHLYFTQLAHNFSSFQPSFSLSAILFLYPLSLSLSPNQLLSHHLSHFSNLIFDLFSPSHLSYLFTLLSHLIFSYHVFLFYHLSSHVTSLTSITSLSSLSLSHTHTHISHISLLYFPSLSHLFHFSSHSSTLNLVPYIYVISHTYITLLPILIHISLYLSLFSLSISLMCQFSSLSLSHPYLDHVSSILPLSPIRLSIVSLQYHPYLRSPLISTISLTYHVYLLSYH